jgi:hypothetical protein
MGIVGQKASHVCKAKIEMNIATARLVATARNKLLHAVKPRSHADTSRECNLNCNH